MEENKVIRILNIVPNMRAAGIETFIMNVYRNIDRTKLQFDFLVASKERQFYDNEIEKMGGKIYRLSFKDDKNIIKYIKDLNTFFKDHNEYKIVHGHMQSMMPLYLLIAKRNNIPIRIAHSHNASYEKSLKGFILHILSRFSKYFSTNNWACSNLAGKYLYGNKYFDVIYNGIDINKFVFSNEIRNKKRKELKILNSDNIIIHIARFEKQKNHKFFVKIFKKYSEINQRCKLLLIGEGKYKEDIEKYVIENNLKDKVLFLGIRRDVNELLQAADLFILPSLYEGLPVSAVEAQYAGLNCFLSNRITSEVVINKKSTRMLKLNEELWLQELIKINWKYNREIGYKTNIFNMNEIAKDIENRYISFYK